MEDWLDELEEIEREAKGTEEVAKQKRTAISEQIDGLWRALREQLQVECERYRSRFPSKPIATPEAALPEFSVNTTGRYPSVHLLVKCCGTSGRQIEYVYNIARNFDVPQVQQHGRLLVDSNGRDVFLTTPEGLEFSHPREAAVYLLMRVVDPSRLKDPS